MPRAFKCFHLYTVFGFTGSNLSLDEEGGTVQLCIEIVSLPSGASTVGDVTGGADQVLDYSTATLSGVAPASTCHWYTLT